MLIRRYIQRRPSGPWKKMKLLQVRKWRGFKVEIYNNGSRHRLRYEWKVYPLSPNLKKGAALRYPKNRQTVNVINDNTSTYDKMECWLDAKCGINETRALVRILNVDAYWHRACNM